jgi:ABC-type antimicrobial peptide transport system permease subunit
MSLGASRADVLRMIVLQGASQALAGSVVGLVGALLLSKLMGQLLFGVKPTDPLTFVMVTVVLGLAALLAASVPARKATRVEPMAALRSE